MSNRDELIEIMAPIICETGNVDGFRCTCPHRIDGWCLGGRALKQAAAALAAAEAAGYEIRRVTP